MREILFQPRSNRETWTELFAFVDEESDEGIRLTLSDGTPRVGIAAYLHPEIVGYHPFWRDGVYYDRPLPSIVPQCAGTVASLDNGGIVIVDNGVIEVRFVLSGLHPGRWHFSMLVDDGFDRIEPFRGHLPILSC